MDDKTKPRLKLKSLITRPIVIAVAILMLLSIGGLVYTYLSDKAKSNDDNSGINSEQSAETIPELTDKQKIDQIQEKILAGEDSFENRMTLAELYAKERNVKKTNFNLGKARFLADPSNESHASRLAAVELNLKLINETP